MTDARNFLLDTDSPLDKVVGYQTGSASVSAFSPINLLFDHGLDFRPLAIGRWSTDPSFNLSYDEMWTLSPIQLSVAFRTSVDKLHVGGFNLRSSTQTVYWKVLYFMPSNVDAQADFTQQNLDSFNINTDYNYTKLLQAGVHSGSTGTITHSLGYYPQVEAWWDDGMFMNSAMAYHGDLPRTELTTSSLVFKAGVATTPTAWHYRIYADEL